MKKPFVFASIIGLVVVLGILCFLHISNTAHAMDGSLCGMSTGDICPAINASISTSGNNITVTGSYTGSMVQENVTCGSNNVPMLINGGFDSVSYFTDTGKAGSVTNTTTNPGADGSCTSSSNPASGTFSLNFTDDITYVHTLTLYMANPYGGYVTQVLNYGSAHTYTITASPGTGGQINGSSSLTTQTVPYGSNATLTVAPNSGYTINTVSGCYGTLSGNTYTTGEF